MTSTTPVPSEHWRAAGLMLASTVMFGFMVVAIRLASASLHAFVAIAETGSFSAAGERLHLTQPAISNALARLRLHFEDDLLVQVGGRLHHGGHGARQGRRLRHQIAAPSRRSIGAADSSWSAASVARA